LQPVVAAADDHIGVCTEDFFLRFSREGRQNPVVDAHESEGPGGRAAATADLGADIDQIVETALESTKTRRPHEPEEPRLAHGSDVGNWNPSGAFGVAAALAQCRYKGTCALERIRSWQPPGVGASCLQGQRGVRSPASWRRVPRRWPHVLTARVV
jgi:hypothetical protein